MALPLRLRRGADRGLLKLFGSVGCYYRIIMKKRRTNRAKRLVAQPRFRARVEQAAKGRGSYQRKPKRPLRPGQDDS